MKQNKKQLKKLRRNKLVKKNHNISKIKSKPVTQPAITDFNMTDMSWKSTVIEKGSFGQKIEKPYFDPHYGIKYMDLMVDNENEFIPSEEMVEWLIKSISDIDPLSLPSIDGHVHGKYTVTSFTILMWMFYPTGESKNNKENVRKFNKYKHLINNEKMLYLFLVRNYQCSPKQVDLDEFNRVAKSMSLKERLRLSTFGLNSTIDKDHNDYMKQLNGEYTHVYRTFRVRKGEPIRKGVTKQDNFDWTSHQEGKGSSYSLSKTRAITISRWLHKSMLEKYGKESWEDMTTFMSNGHGSDSLQLQDDVYCAVGLFKIKKQDVIAATNSLGEDEIIILSDDVELIDYKFLNILDFISQWFVWKTQDLVKTNYEVLKETSETDFINETDWYDICYDYLSNNDKIDDNFLNDFIGIYNNLARYDFPKFYQNLCSMLFGENASFDIHPHPHKRTNSPRYTLGMKRKDGIRMLHYIPHPASIRPRTGLHKLAFASPIKKVA